MKKILIVGIIASAITTPSFALVHCVALNPTTTTCSQTAVNPGEVNWSAACDTGNAWLSIGGIGTCSNLRGFTVGTTADTLTTHSTASANQYCWCRLTSPAVSKWVFAATMTNGGMCQYNCASECAELLRTYKPFSSALFSNLSE